MRVELQKVLCQTLLQIDYIAAVLGLIRKVIFDGKTLVSG